VRGRAGRQEYSGHRRGIFLDSLYGTYQDLGINSLEFGSTGIRSVTMWGRIDWIWLFFFLLFWCYVVWTWATWLKSREKVNPRWKVIVVVAGLCCATASTALDAFLYIHAVVKGGYPFYHPVELFCIRFGGLTAILAIISAMAGTGRLRLHVAIISITNFLLWFMDAMFQ
jgi:hypothetical protein